MTHREATGGSMSLDELMNAPQYTVSFSDKEQLFPPILEKAFEHNAARSEGFANFLRGYGYERREDLALSDFPPLPVSMFKHFDLLTCDRDSVVRELNSSSTTGQQPSRIFLDKLTAQRQTKAVLSVLKSYLGRHRRPYLVLDVPESNDPGAAVLTARGAAIRAFESFSTETVYGLHLQDGVPTVDWGAVEDFSARFGQQDVLVFGFTFLLWSRVVAAFRQNDRRLTLSRAKVFHGGGWKKLTEQAVSKESFNQGLGACLGCSPQSIYDFYGMVEQVGSIFVDCEEGHKHAPNFATVLIVDPTTLQMVPPGEDGLIEVISLLPRSYPGQVLLTEDRGRLIAVDDCPCGRKGVAFRFLSRVERVELRGCGDTLAATLDSETGP